jgi:hypothetical protein
MYMRPLAQCHIDGSPTPLPRHGFMYGDYRDPMLDLSSLDLQEIAAALADQTDDEHRWLINPQTGEAVLWTSDTGIDGQTPVALDDLNLICIDPLPHVWYQDMADFAEQVSDNRAGRRLARAIEGKGAFRRFKDELHQHPHLLPAWHAFRDARAQRRAVDWLVDNSPGSLALPAPGDRRPERSSDSLCLTRPPGLLEPYAATSGTYGSEGVCDTMSHDASELADWRST